MASQTRWPHAAATNELVEVPLEWSCNGAADMTRAPMIVDGVDQSASIQGTAVSYIQRGGVGLYNVGLKQPWPWLLSAHLEISTPLADAAAPYTVKVCTDLTYQAATGPYVRIQIFDTANALADPPVAHTLRGSLVFRNRRVGS